MRTYELAPLYRSTVGFDRLFDMIDSASPRPDWPPYDIEKTADDQYRITMAVAGFKQDEIELIQHGVNLHVSGQKKGQPAGRQMLHQGIAQGIAGRGFKQTFSLADHVKVAGAALEDGLLTVDLVREIPEQLKPRRIDIAGTSVASSAQDNQPKQIDDTAPRQVA